MRDQRLGQVAFQVFAQTLAVERFVGCGFAGQLDVLAGQGVGFAFRAGMEYRRMGKRRPLDRLRQNL